VSIAFAQLTPGENDSHRVVEAKIAAMKEVARAKSAAVGGSRAFVRAVEEKLNLIAHAKIAGMAPVNENLLGLAFVLLEELKRRPMGNE
jgi:hypothetical protein